MSEENGRLLAAIAQLEERLTAKMDAGFKKMKKLTEEKLEEMTSEVTGMKKGMKAMKKEMSETREGMKKEMGEQLAGMEDRIMEKLETVRNGNDGDEEKSLVDGDYEEDGSSLESITSTRSVRGWSSHYDTDYDEDEEELMTAIEPGISKEKGDWVRWEAGDEIIKKMQAGRMSKDEEIPSFWNYDPRCLAKEFVGLDQKTFLVDPSTFNICFFDKDILRKISKMLAPMDFLSLSYTCRFLHWRLFTFCTCYAPYTVKVEIRDLKVVYYQKRGERVSWIYEAAPNKTVYTLRLQENDRQSTPSLAKEEGVRAVVARVPSCLRRPFLFDEITVDLTLPFLTKDDLERCLPFILAFRQHARQLRMDISYKNICQYIREYIPNAEKFIDYEAMDAFLRAIKTTDYSCYARWGINLALKLFENCPYAHEIECLSYLHFDSSGFENIILPNRIGHYYDPPLSAIIRTINEFFRGNQNLDYQEYHLVGIGRPMPFLEYFHSRFDEFEEYVCVRQWNRLGYGVVWEYTSLRFGEMTIEENGEKIRMRLEVSNLTGLPRLQFSIGKAEAFAKRLAEDFHPDLEDCKASSQWYQMETAVEPEERDDE